MRRVLLGLVAIVVLAVAGVLIAPSFIDWNGFKDEIAAEIRAATGRELVIDGDLSLALLPAPSLSASQVQLASLPGATHPSLLRLKALRLDIRLLPLLGGRIEIAGLSLVEPVIELERLADGRKSWSFAEDSSPAPKESTAKSNPNAVRIKDVRIENGTLVYRDARAKTLERIAGIDARLAAETLAGPFRVSGKLVARGVPLALDVALGRIDGPEAAPLALSISRADGSARVHLGGAVSAIESAPQFAGKLRIESANLAAALGNATSAGGGLAQPLRVEANVAASAERVRIDQLVVELGQARGSGSIAAAFGDRPQIDAALRIQRLDLDKFLAPPTRQAAPSATLPFELPIGIVATIELQIDLLTREALQFHDVKLAASLADGEATVSQAGLRLPGGAEISLFGFIATKGGTLRYDGTVEAHSDDLRSTLKAFALDPGDIPSERLRRASFGAKVNGDERELRLGDGKLRLDASEIGLAATFALRARPSFGVRVTIDQLNLDAYLPQSASKAAPAAQPGAPFAGLDAFDASLALRVGALTYRKTPIQGVALDATLVNGVVTVGEARVQNVAGARAELAGIFAGLDAIPRFKGTAKIEADDATGLLRALGLDQDIAPRKLGRVAINLTTDAAADRVTFSGEIEAASVKAAFADGIIELAPTLRAEMALRIAHPELATLIRSFSPEYRPAQAALGPLAIAAKLRGTFGGAELGNIDAKLGPIELQGKANLSLAGARPLLDAQLTARAIDMDAFLPAKGARQRAEQAAPLAGFVPVAMRLAATTPAAERFSRAPIDTDALGVLDANLDLRARSLIFGGLRFDDPHLRATLKDKVLDIAELAGKLADGTVDVAARLDATAIPRLEATLKIARANLQKALNETAGLDMATGTLDFDLALTGAGRSAFDLVAALGGNGRLAVRDGVVKGIDLPAVSARLKQIDRVVDIVGLANAALGGGQTRYRALDGTLRIEKGVVRTDDLRLVAEAGEGRGKGSVDLARWQLDFDADFNLTEHRDAPPFGVKLHGPLDEPQKILRLEALQAWVLQRGAGSLIRRFAPGAREARPEDILRGLLDGLQRR